MRAGERPRAVVRVLAQLVRVHRLEIGGRLHVAELPHVERARPRQRPAQKHVARGLHHALAAHDALAVVRELARPEMRRQHRRQRLFDLQDERVVVVRGEQRDGAARADAPDADDLDRGVEQRVPVEQHLHVGRQVPRVGADDLGDVEVVVVRRRGVVQRRRVVDEPPRAVDDVRELRDGGAHGVGRRLIADAARGAGALPRCARRRGSSSRPTARTTLRARTPRRALACAGGTPASRPARRSRRCARRNRCAAPRRRCSSRAA